MVFTRDAGERWNGSQGSEWRCMAYEEGNSQLFDVDRSVVTKHLSNIFKEGELDENSTCANFAQVADNGKHTNTNFIR